MSRAEYVASWLRDRFAEHPTWPHHELKQLAWAREGIDVNLWWESPLVREIGIRKDTMEIWPGCHGMCWTVLPEGRRRTVSGKESDYTPVAPRNTARRAALEREATRLLPDSALERGVPMAALALIVDLADGIDDPARRAEFKRRIEEVLLMCRP